MITDSKILQGWKVYESLPRNHGSRKEMLKAKRLWGMKKKKEALEKGEKGKERRKRQSE